MTAEGANAVNVVNPAPSTATSAAQPFVVASGTPVANITSGSISDTANGNGTYVLSLTGTDFVSDSTIEWNGVGLTTTYLSPWALTATVTVTDYTSRPAAVTVANPAGTSPVFELH